MSRSISYGSGQPTGWLTATLAGTSAPTSLTLQATTGSLAGGTYTATVTVSSTVPGVTSRTISVTFTVHQPQIGLSATTSGFPASGHPARDTIDITNAGSGSLSGLSVTVRSAASGWLTATLDRTTAPAELRLAISPGTLAVGTHSGTVTVRSNVPGVTDRVVSVTYTITASYGTHVRPILTSSACTACHSGSSPTNGQLDLTGDPYDRLVERSSHGYSGRLRVDPFFPHPDNSILICKIQKPGQFGSHTSCGSVNMGNLSETQIEVIHRWIRDGAPRN